MKCLTTIIWFAFIGSLSFWLPDVLVHLTVGKRFDSPHVRLITILMPVTFFVAYSVARKFAASVDFKWLGAAMLLGVWLTGGMFMTLAATTSGGGFAGVDGVRGGFQLALLGALPPITYMMSAYDGSLGALLAVTVGALLFSCIRWSRIPLSFRRSTR